MKFPLFSPRPICDCRWPRSGREHSNTARILPLALAILFFAGTVSHSASKSRLTEDGKFGGAMNMADGARKLVVPQGDERPDLPVSYEFWVRLQDASAHNILLSVAPKNTPDHWELFTTPQTGLLALFMPQLQATTVTRVPLVDGKWHFVAFRIGKDGVQAYVDGVQALDLPGKPAPAAGDLYVGGIEGSPELHLRGAIDDLRIGGGERGLAGFVPAGPMEAEKTTRRLYRFDEIDRDDTPDASGSKVAALVLDEWTMPKDTRFLDEVQDELYAASGLSGDASVDEDSKRPALVVVAEPCQGQGGKLPSVEPESLLLSGEWLMKDSEPFTWVPPYGNRKEDTQGVKEGWHKPGFDRAGWDKVTVPTTVQSALVKLGKLPDPFWDANTYDELTKYGEPKEAPFQLRFTRVERRDWWFAREFTVPANWKGRALQVRFDGIDYSGSVYLNGQPLGHHAGMFGGPVCDVSKMIRFDGPNLLAVRVDRVPPIWLGILKGSPGWGWHYGHLVSLGIWRDVWLDVVPEMKVCDPFVVTKKIAGEKAVLQIEYSIESTRSGVQSAEVAGEIRGANFEAAAPVCFLNMLQVPHGRSRYRTEVTIDSARLWWPLNYGDPNLYSLNLTIGGKQDARPVAYSSASTRFGIRTIEMRPMAGTVAGTFYRWQFVINGQPMFIKGSTWCWSDPMLDCDPAKYERLLELSKRAGIQMLRAWGGGIVETEEFYRLCDEKGIMVYQEFPFCWGPPPFPITDAAVVDRQVSRVVKQLRNHPSLVMWGGGNENGPSPGTDEGLLLAGKRCREFDPSRPFHRTDAWGGSTHNWKVYHHGDPMDSGYQNQPSVWYGEYGLPSMPNITSSKKFLPEEKLQKWPPLPTDGGVIAHMNMFFLRDLLKTMIYADYGPITSWDQYTEYSQMAQGDWLRYAAEGQRSGSGENKGGLWFYKMTDLFPGHSWAVVDYYGSPKLSYYRTKQTFKPQCAFAAYEKLDWGDGEPFVASLNVSNDSPRELSGAKVSAAIYGSDLREVWSRNYGVKTLAPNQRELLEDIRVPIPAEKMKPFLLAVSLRDSSGKLLSDQWYWLNYQAKTAVMKDCTKLPRYFAAPLSDNEMKPLFEAFAQAPEARLLKLPRTKLETKTVSTSGGKGYFLVKNVGKVPAFNVLIDGFPDGWKDYLEDNSFSLRAGEERAIPFEVERDLKPDQIGIRAWNADSTTPINKQ